MISLGALLGGAETNKCTWSLGWLRKSLRSSAASIAVCVTRDDFWSLATNLALLLEKDTADSYPWAVNIIDLSNLAEAWSHFHWGRQNFESI